MKKNEIEIEIEIKIEMGNAIDYYEFWEIMFIFKYLNSTLAFKPISRVFLYFICLLNRMAFFYQKIKYAISISPSPPSSLQELTVDIEAVDPVSLSFSHLLQVDSVFISSANYFLIFKHFIVI